MIIFDDLIFPNDIIKMACTGKRKRFTDVGTTASGFTQTNIRWSRTLREFDIGSVARPVPQWEIIAKLHEVLEGRAYGCLFRDPTDSLVAAGEGVLRPIDSNRIGLSDAGTGFGVPTYRLAKRYSIQSRFKDVDTAKPEVGTVSLFKNGLPVTIGNGVDPGTASIDFSTGIITFAQSRSLPISAITTGSDTIISVGGSLLLNVGQRVFLTGLTGPDADFLNNQSFAVTGNTYPNYHIGANTIGRTITASGFATTYPQPDDVITWTGSYFIPVAFANDDLDWSILAGGREDSRYVTGPSIVMTEQRVK